MKRFFVVLILAALSRSEAATMSKAEALTAAKVIWKDSAVVDKVQNLYEVGCSNAGQFIVVGSSTAGYREALNAVNLQTNGLHTVTAVIRDTDGNTATSDPVPVILCNKP